MTDISVAKIKPAQSSDVRYLYEQLVRELYPSPEAQNIFLRQWTQDQLSRECIKPETALLVASTADRPVAGLVFGSGIEGGVGTIYWFGVDEDFRGQNIGASLLDAIEKFYLKIGAHKVKLFCNTSEARLFYEKSGYETEGFHPRHWWHMDCWSMGKIVTVKTSPAVS
jgi:ribosomal protein S18 acetylase RimI-like enzyme